MAAEQGMVDFWLAARPVDALAEPANCLNGRDDITGRLGEITRPAVVVHGIDYKSIEMSTAHPEAVNVAIIGFLSDLPT